MYVNYFKLDKKKIAAAALTACEVSHANFKTG
jgi:hypothetical protein